MNEQAQCAVVTGANRGLGLETARQLASAGLKVVLTGRDADKATEAAHLLAGQGQRVVPHQLDVTDADSIAALRATLAERFGRLDVIHNNAGISSPS